MSELSEVLERLRVAKRPEEVFGTFTCPANEMYPMVQKQFRRLAKVCHEDRYLDAKDKEVSREAFKLLSVFWEEAQTRIKDGVYGNKNTKPSSTTEAVCFNTARYKYTISDRIHSGGMCGIFIGTVEDKKTVTSPVIVKVPHSSKDNDLMEREARSLDLMKKKAKAISVTPDGLEISKKLSLRVPALLESIKLQQPGEQQKVVNTFLKTPGMESGWYTLEEIRRAYPNGVDPKVMVFIWNRIIEGLTLAHYSGVVHCALTPNHVLIQAKEHAGQIIDWTASCRIGQDDKVPYVDDKFLGFFPEEIINSNGRPTPASDIFMSAWCMVYVLGGDPQKKVCPQHIGRPLVELFNRCLQPQRRYRPQTADVLYQEFRQVAKEMFGPRKFVELVMPCGMANV